MQKIIIAIVSKNGAIGKDGKLLFNIKEDMIFFKKMTENHIVIMGRKTYESIGKSLPNRINIVITRDPAFKPINPDDQIVLANSVNMALAISDTLSQSKTFIIGGVEIYKQTIDLVDDMLITYVDEDIHDADAMFPLVNVDQWDLDPIGDLTEKAKVYQFTRIKK